MGGKNFLRRIRAALSEGVRGRIPRLNGYKII